MKTQPFFSMFAKQGGGGVWWFNDISAESRVVFFMPSLNWEVPAECAELIAVSFLSPVNIQTLIPAFFRS